MEAFENIVRKGENAGNQPFLLFPQYFLPVPKQISVLSVTFIVSSANLFILDQSKFFPFGKRWPEIDDTASKSKKQDQTAYMRKLTLVYIL